MLQEASINALRATCKTVGNKDVDPFIPVLIDSIAKPSEVPECVHKLSATTFVQVGQSSAFARRVLTSCACGKARGPKAGQNKAVCLPMLAWLLGLDHVSA